MSLNLTPVIFTVRIRVYGVYLENGKQFEAITHILPERSRKDLQKRVLRKRKNSKIYSRQFPFQIKVELISTISYSIVDGLVLV